MAIIRSILADISTGISELKKDPMGVVEKAEGRPVAVLNRNQPVFYAVPAKAYEELIDRLEDYELAKIVEDRKEEPTFEVDVDDIVDNLHPPV
ncbi:type II toxin-antitoxin system Phd/YefM family antitoxin [Candidatus Sororendozoicomonas aggregata]|uniref:type II toxin-antitoxin system Phd/YefM family antitoxin n=1 Tax=Candidatus Sororendozoicomonas aggregata TaxID=3073239 RepID=UPI003B75D1EA